MKELSGDDTPHAVGEIICKLHEKIQEHGNGWQKSLRDAGYEFGSWLLHPLRRNWCLISRIGDIINELDDKKASAPYAAGCFMIDKLTIEDCEQIAKDGFLAKNLENKNTMGLTAHIANQLADAMRENESMKESLGYISFASNGCPVRYEGEDVPEKYQRIIRSELGRLGEHADNTLQRYKESDNE